MKTIAILHYASPPTVGGVESTIFHHANVLTDLGYNVKVVSGRGAEFDDRIETYIDPLFDSLYPEILEVKQELDTGHVPKAFDVLVAQMEEALTKAIGDCDVCIVHNIVTLNKNLPLTVALAKLVEQNGMKVIAWCHDLAWTDELYHTEVHDDHPWNLLKQCWDNVTYVTVSAPRQTELAEMMGIAEDEVKVIVPGVDPELFWHWTSTTTELAEQLDWMDADGILLLPTHLTPRKNVGLALHVIAELRRQSSQDFRLIITGPPGPHNPNTPGYLDELLRLREQMGLENEVHFLYSHGDAEEPLIPDDETMGNLYQLADGLFFPSLQEGFGIPILEAGLAGIPVFCSDIPALRATGQKQVSYFDPSNDAPEWIAAHILETLDNSPAYHLRVRVRKLHRWSKIVREQLVPLLGE